MQIMQTEEDRDETDLRDVVPVAVVAGALIGALAVARLAIGEGRHGWEAVTTTVVTTLGGTAVLWLVVRELQDIQRRTIEWLRKRVRHGDEIIEWMGADIEADELRYVAEVTRLEGEIQRLRQERLQAVAEALREAEADRRQLVAGHQRELAEVERKAESRGYINGVRVRLGGGGGGNGRVVRLVRQDGPGNMRS